MTVLHLLSQLEVTGTETYVESLVGELSKRGHRFLVASDTLTRPIQAEYRLVRLHRRGWLDRYKNILEIKAIVRRERVSLIHAHSRASSWVGSFVSKACGIPLVTTVHGIQHRHLSRRLFPAFGQAAIAICENIRDQLVRELGLSPKRVSVIPNGIDLTRYVPSPTVGSREDTLLFVGRLSGPKRSSLLRFMSESLEEFLFHLPESKFCVVGKLEERHDLEKVPHRIRKFCGQGRVLFLGYKKDVAPVMRQACAVMGAGRVVLEAMAMGKPVVSLGETDYIGILTPDNFASACKSNFGDCSPKQSHCFKNVGKTLAQLLKDEARCRELGSWGCKAVEAFDVCKVADAVEETYNRCLSSRS